MIENLSMFVLGQHLKSIPDAATEDGKSEIGGAAGYLFFQTRDGYHFRSIDKIFTGEPKKKFIFNNATQLPEGYDAKILTCDISSDIDVGKNLMMGMYNNRSIFLIHCHLIMKCVVFLKLKFLQWRVIL